MIPFLIKDETKLPKGSYVLIVNAEQALKDDQPYEAYVLHDGAVEALEAETGDLTEEEREILIQGCLINYYKSLKA
jgi:aconitate hydratase